MRFRSMTARRWRRQGHRVVSINLSPGRLRLCRLSRPRGVPAAATSGCRTYWRRCAGARNIADFGGDPGQSDDRRSVGRCHGRRMLLLAESGRTVRARDRTKRHCRNPLPDRIEADAAAPTCSPARLPGIAALAAPAGGSGDGAARNRPARRRWRCRRHAAARPIVDGSILPGQVAAMEAAGRRRAVPVMVGLNADEGVLSPSCLARRLRYVRALAARIAGDAGADALPGGPPLDSEMTALAARQLTRLHGLASLVDWARMHHAPPLPITPIPNRARDRRCSARSTRPKCPTLSIRWEPRPTAPSRNTTARVAATMSQL